MRHANAKRLSALLFLGLFLGGCFPVDPASTANDGAGGSSSESFSFNGLSAAYNLDHARIRLEWIAATGDVGGYVVYEVALDQSLTAVGQVGPTQTYYVVSGLSNLTQKTYVVRARDSKGEMDGNFIAKTVRTFNGASAAEITAAHTLSIYGLNTLTAAADSVNVYVKYQGDTDYTSLGNYPLPTGVLDVTLDSTKYIESARVRIKDITTLQEDTNTKATVPTVESTLASQLSVTDGFQSMTVVSSKFRTTFAGTCGLNSASVANGRLSVTATGGTVIAATCTSGVLAGQVDYDVPNIAVNNPVIVKENYGAGTIQTSDTGQIMTCPLNYVAVPGDTDLSVDPFCVSKFEMKAVTSNPVTNASAALANANGNQTYNSAWYPMSRPDGTPFVNITQRRALVQCDKLNDAAGLPGRGAGGPYRLITNRQWQAMARNLEYRTSNWSGGAVGGGQIPRGHSDNAISDANTNNASTGISFTGHSALAAASADGTTVPWSFADEATELAAGYRGTGNTSAQAVGSGWEQRRTHRLSNGQVIWDVAGNVWEWVNFNETSGPGGPTTLDSFTEDGITNSLTTFNSRLLPTQPSLAANWRELNDTAWHSPNNSSALDPLWFLPKGYFAGTSPYSGNLSNYSLGRIYTTNSVGSYAVLRGAAWSDLSSAGVFAASLNVGPTNAGSNLGFRCVCAP